MQWCVGFVKQERDYVQDGVWLLGFVCEFNIELAIVLIQGVPLLRFWVQTWNPVSVVTLATNK